MRFLGKGNTITLRSSVKPKPLARCVRQTSVHWNYERRCTYCVAGPQFDEGDKRGGAVRRKPRRQARPGLPRQLRSQLAPRCPSSGPLAMALAACSPAAIKRSDLFGHHPSLRKLPRSLASLLVVVVRLSIRRGCRLPSRRQRRHSHDRRHL